MRKKIRDYRHSYLNLVLLQWVVSTFFSSFHIIWVTRVYKKVIGIKFLTYRALIPKERDLILVWEIRVLQLFASIRTCEKELACSMVIFRFRWKRWRGRRKHFGHQGFATAGFRDEVSGRISYSNHVFELLISRYQNVMNVFSVCFFGMWCACWLTSSTFSISLDHIGLFAPIIRYLHLP